MGNESTVNKRRVRLLTAEEIECRVGIISERGISLLLYKDARVDQNLLDEIYGPFNWSREHKLIGDALFCTVSIRDDEGNWISKQDVGVPSYAEPVKGAASDSFKRACFQWGIGRELYTAPFIWIPKEKVEIKEESGNRNGEKKKTVKDRFSVREIGYDEKRNINLLKIENQKHEIVYSHVLTAQSEGSGGSVNEEKMSKIQAKQILPCEKEQKLREELIRTGISEQAVCERYQVNHIQDLNQILYERAMEALGKTKNADTMKKSA